MRISDEELSDLLEEYPEPSSNTISIVAHDLQEARAENSLLTREVLVYSEYKEAFYKERGIKLERDKYKAALEAIVGEHHDIRSWIIAEEALKDE
jgi:ABC-type nitrate/sulfonate/bicarbonate transport system ATPase subunit